MDASWGWIPTWHTIACLFVPIEGALATALAGEPELFTYGWDRRVVLVGPPTLLMTMRTVASIWRYESQSRSLYFFISSANLASASLRRRCCLRAAAAIQSAIAIAARRSNALRKYLDSPRITERTDDDKSIIPARRVH